MFSSVISDNFLVFEIDNYSFIFKRVSTLKYRACNDIELNEGDISSFIIKQTCDTSEDFFIENNHKDESLPVWYDYVKLAVGDKRIQHFLESRRMLAESKYLELPFVKQFSMTEGKIPLL